MKKIRLYLAVTLLSLTFLSSISSASEDEKLYQYANNYAEYSVTLPEAPSVKSLWGDSDNIPYLSSHPQSGFIGEIATYIKTDPQSDDSFGVEIIFLKADKDFLNSLDKNKLMGFIEKDLSIYSNIQNKSVKFEESDKYGNKRGSISGVIINTENKPIFRAEYFLTGSSSITVIKVRYNLENKKMNDYYKTLVKSIKYLSE